ncbi:MAG: hypothetical protein JW940_29745 [Polyangiaceae bacterium]|nr:hypothetical protein [Polyangiaceae bacterium]
MKARGAAGAFGAMLVSVAMSAQAGPPVKLTLLGCKSLAQGEVGRILEAELGARINTGDRPETTEVEVECLGVRIVLRVRDPITRKGVSRQISLEKQQPEAHTRLVALAATELVLASWSELEFNPRPRVEPEGPVLEPEFSAAALQTVQDKRTSRGLTGQPTAVRKRRRGDPPPSELRMVALASARKFFHRDSRLFLIGGGFRLGEELTNLVSWSVDGTTEAGETVDSGSEDQRSDSIQTTTIGAAVLFFHRGPVLTARVGGGLRLAVTANLGSESAAPGTSYVVSALGWPLLMSSVTVRLGKRALSELSVEGSYSTDADRNIAGPWGALSLGFGVFL